MTKDSSSGAVISEMIGAFSHYNPEKAARLKKAIAQDRQELLKRIESELKGAKKSPLGTTGIPLSNTGFNMGIDKAKAIINAIRESI